MVFEARDKGDSNICSNSRFTRRLLCKFRIFFLGGKHGKPCPLGAKWQLLKNGEILVGWVDKSMFKYFAKQSWGREGGWYLIIYSRVTVTSNSDMPNMIIIILSSSMKFFRTSDEWPKFRLFLRKTCGALCKIANCYHQNTFRQYPFAVRHVTAFLQQS